MTLRSGRKASHATFWPAIRYAKVASCWRQKGTRIRASKSSIQARLISRSLHSDPRPRRTSTGLARVMPLLEIKNLHVEIDGKTILNGLDLTVNKGEVHAIMRPNGSGKSTLAYVLAGKADYTPTSGEVLFNGKNLFDMAPDERAAA